MGRRKDIRMTIERKVSSIESSFSMESLMFDDECRNRVKEVLTDKVTVSDAIAELNKKYRVSAHQYERSGV
jgi:predicted RNase H-like nuclease (RuvC/YqgF family)